jgi:hypothetical protein
MDGLIVLGGSHLIGCTFIPPAVAVGVAISELARAERVRKNGSSTTRVASKTMTPIAGTYFLKDLLLSLSLRRWPWLL